MKTSRILILTLLLAGVIIYFNKCRNDKNTNASANTQNRPSLLVNAIVAGPTDIEDKVYASGTLIANEEVEIRNEIAGRVTSINFMEGSRIKKGDLLIQLYDDDLLAQQKKLMLQRDIAMKTEERQRDLLSVNGVSKQEYELSLNQLNSIHADIELIESEISKTKIRAPFDGTIGLKTISTGAYIPVNTRIATMQSLNPIKLEFGIPEKYRPFISDDAEVQFTTESTDSLFTGKIYAFEPKIELETRSILVRATCQNNDYKLYPGAFASIEIPLKKISGAILVPTQSVVPELKAQVVYLVKDGKAQKVKVVTGVRNDSAIQIISGIESGDTVLTTGIMQVKQGVPVQIKVK